ncbi:MAG: hypothetical protein ACI9F2_000395 [Lysobacterales bacterium]|jgi:uncharacterized protein YfiM (DUF2279 family)
MTNTFKRIISNILLLALITFSLPSLGHTEGEDKVAHSVVSVAIATVAYNVFKKTTDLTDNQAKVAAFLTTIAVGALKETIDDDFSAGDLGADAGGALLGAVIGFEF